MLRKVRPLAPIVVLATLSAVPVVVVRVFTIEVLFWVALTVPPPVAVNAALAPVLRLMPPLKLISVSVASQNNAFLAIPDHSPAQRYRFLEERRHNTLALPMTQENNLIVSAPLTQSVAGAPLRAPPAKVIVPFKPTRLTFFAPPVEVVPPRTTLTVGAPTPVRSSAPPFVFIDIVLTFSVPTFAPAIAVPPVQLPMLKPESVLLPGAPASATQLPAVLVVVGVGAAALNNVMALTTRLTP